MSEKDVMQEEREKARRILETYRPEEYLEAFALALLHARLRYQLVGFEEGRKVAKEDAP